MGGIYIAWTLKYCKWCFHALQLIPTVSIALGCCFWWKTNGTVWELWNVVWSVVSIQSLLECMVGSEREMCPACPKEGCPGSVLLCAEAALFRSFWSFKDPVGKSTWVAGWFILSGNWSDSLKTHSEQVLGQSVDSVKQFFSHEWVNRNIHYWGVFPKLLSEEEENSGFLEVFWASAMTVSCGHVFY